MTVKTVADLFEETDDWLNDEEAMAMDKLFTLVNDYVADTGRKPTRLYVGNNEELQSYMLWFASYYGLEAEKTTGDTYVCGQFPN